MKSESSDSSDLLEHHLGKLPLVWRARETRSIRADLYAQDLFTFCRAKDGLNYPDVNWKTHGEIIEILEAPSKFKLIVVPRGTLKSSIVCVGFVIQSLLRNPNERILIDSDVYTNSKNFIREIKGHLESPRLMSLFGDFKSANWNEGEITVKQRNKIFKEASVTAGGVGTTKVGQHYSMIIGDDYNNDKNSNSPEMRQKVINHFKHNMSILEPGGTYVITATRYAEDDIPGFILQNILGVTNIKYGCILSDKTKAGLQPTDLLSRYV